MTLVACEVTKGLRPQEATVQITDFHGQAEFMPVDRTMIVVEDGKNYLSVQVLYVHEKDKAALIALPIESDSGAHRIWVRVDTLKGLEKVPA
jgi:hypothetical protein